MIIDFFTHIYPRKVLKALPQPLPQALAAYISSGPHFYDPEARFKDMDRLHIDIQGISVVPGGFEKQPQRIFSVANDGISEIAERYPDRFVGFATVPSLDGEALDELKRTVEDLGLKGVQIYSNIGGEPIDLPKYRSFFDMVTKYDIPVLLHPAATQFTPWIREYGLLMTFGWPFDTTLAMARLAFSGIMERYPNLKIVTHHAGAMIPFFAKRIEVIYDQGQQLPTLSTNAKTKKHVIESFRKFYADTAIYDWTPGLQVAYSFFGPKKLVFGTDYPWILGDSPASVKRLKIPEREKSEILGLNAKKLLKIK